MQLIAGAALITSCVHVDPRGEVAVFEGDDQLPFVPARLFLMRTVDRKAVRGGHANSCDELIVAMTGSVLADIDNGTEQSSVRLDRCD